MGRIREEQGLPTEFNLRGYENLQPCCRRCNARKLAEPFLPGRTAIELGVARRAKGRIEELIASFRKADQKNKLRFAIAAALESGQLSEREIANVISAAGANPEAFRLSTTFQLFGDDPVGEISIAAYERYLDVRLSLPPEMQKGLRLVAHDNREVRVLTLRQFQQAVANGFYALSNSEMQVAYCSFERPLAVLRILRTAEPAQQSFMDEPRVGLSDISLLPATLLFVTEDLTSDPNFAGQRKWRPTCSGSNTTAIVRSCLRSKSARSRCSAKNSAVFDAFDQLMRRKGGEAPRPDDTIT